MPKRDDIRTVLIIGPGPVVIGQSGEFDSSGTQACKALRHLGCKVVLADSNPATVMADPDMADATYIEPLNLQVLTEIIAAERPDAILPVLGGQTSLNLCSELHRAGVLGRYGIKVLGVGVDAIQRAEDRTALKETMSRLGIDLPRSRPVESVEDADRAAATLGYPVVVRPAFATSGTGGGLAYNTEELRLVAARGLAASLIHQVLIEESVLGWQELELEVVRDAANRMLMVGGIENVDGMGIHTGDSCCTVPMLTVDPGLQARLQGLAFRIVEELQVAGGANVQFAHDPETGRVVLIEINPRISRSSALVSQATGFPIARVSVLLACGLTLDEIPGAGGGTLAQYVPPVNRVAVTLPRWGFEKFGGIEDRLGPQMRAVGGVIGVGRTYKEALQKAVRSLEIGRSGLGFARDVHELSLDALMNLLAVPTSERRFLMYEALRKGADVAKLSELTHVRPWFIEQMRELVELEERVRACRGSEMPDALLAEAKRDGFSDRYLAHLLERDEAELRVRRRRLGVVPSWEPMSGGIESAAGYHSTYHAPDTVPVGDRRKIMVLGGGPGRIGQGAELDTCTVQAALAVREAGIEPVVVNSNPYGVSTDPDVAQRLYLEPMTLEDVLAVYEKERPEGVIIQFGGQTPLAIARELAAAGVRILGTPLGTIELAEDRDRFRGIMQALGIPMPAAAAAGSREQARAVAARIGYPLMVRTPGAGAGQSTEIVHDEAELDGRLAGAAALSPERAVVLEKFLDNAIEAEADAVTDGRDAFVPAVMEHIELAGIHSGDSACVIPPISLAPKHVDTIREYTRRIAVELKAVGLMNVQYAVYENTVYVLKADPRAARTIPLVSKVCGLSMARAATQVVLGKSLAELGLRERRILHYGVKESVFPFRMLTEVDPVLGPEMRSSGEVLGLSYSFGRAYFKAQEAAQTTLPLEGTVLFTIADRDKNAAIEPARRFRELGFRILATEGTHAFLKEKGIDTVPVFKVGVKRPNLMDAVKSGAVHLLVNTPSGRKGSADSSHIRRAAIQHNVPYITTTAAAIAAAKGIAARREGESRVRSLQQYHADTLSFAAH